MKHVFIDLGCYDGDTILQFRNWKALAYPPDVDWIVYGFDPNPNFIKAWQRHERSDTIFQQKAAWVEEGEIEMTIGKPAYSSTVMKQKVNWGKGMTLKVPCFDFSTWLEQFRGDHVLLKFDIEGAELPVLTKMMEDGTDDIPTLTMVEWHDGKMPTYSSNKKEIWDNYKSKLVEWR